MIIAMSSDSGGNLTRWTMEQRAWRLMPSELRRVRSDDVRTREVRIVRRDGLRWVALADLTTEELDRLSRGRS